MGSTRNTSAMSSSYVKLLLLHGRYFPTVVLYGIWHSYTSSASYLPGANNMTHMGCLSPHGTLSAQCDYSRLFITLKLTHWRCQHRTRWRGWVTGPRHFQDHGQLHLFSQLRLDKNCSLIECGQADSLSRRTVDPVSAVPAPMAEFHSWWTYTALWICLGGSWEWQLNVDEAMRAASPDFMRSALQDASVISQGKKTPPRLRMHFKGRLV